MRRFTARTVLPATRCCGSGGNDMGIARLGLAAALWLLATAAFAQNQTPNTPPPQIGEDTGVSTTGNGGHIDFGFRGTIYGSNSDEARYQRYRDLRNGPFVDG